MSFTYKTLTAITAWFCFINAIMFVLVPLVIGISTGALAGTVNDVESGKLWFYRHGQSFLIGAVFFAIFLYSIKVRKSLE
ncbi:MAG TPA: hypothetical protein G4O02_17315 [Caldilineae bacterium]|nr:hypothetical protein [Caldilineae bacterium]